LKRKNTLCTGDLRGREKIFHCHEQEKERGEGWWKNIGGGSTLKRKWAPADFEITRELAGRETRDEKLQ